jgi:hypothetical protein
MDHDPPTYASHIAGITGAHIKPGLVAFLYTNNGCAKKETRETIPFTEPKIINYLVVRLTEEKDICNVNYKTLKKEIGEVSRTGKDFPCS